MSKTQYNGHTRVFKEPYRGKYLDLYSIWSSPSGNVTAYFKDKAGRDKFLYKRARKAYFEKNSKGRYVQKSTKDFYLQRWRKEGADEISPSRKSFYDKIRRLFGRSGRYGSKDNYIWVGRNGGFSHYQYDHANEKYIKKK